MNGFLPTCILFDLDGTLVDSLPGIEFSVREAFDRCRLPLLNDNLRQMVGPPIRTILSHAGNVLEESTLNTLELAFRASYDSEGWQQAVCFPGAQHVLQALHDGGHRLFVVSNKPRHASLRILDKEQIRQFFEAVITRDSRSPNYGRKEDMVLTLLAERSIDLESCLMVGDTMEDFMAAVAVGIKFIWMTHGYGSAAQLSSLPVAHSLSSFSQFLPLITKEPICD